MKLKLPFMIGEQYELNEFSLESIDEIIIGVHCYDVYRYIDNDVNLIFDMKVYQIILFYNADILSKVRISLCGNVLLELLKQLEPLKGNTILDNHIKHETFYLPVFDITILEYFDINF